ATHIRCDLRACPDRFGACRHPHRPRVGGMGQPVIRARRPVGEADTKRTTRYETDDDMRLFTQRVTEADLTWWLKLAPTLDWIWAKTYASFAPHHYVVNGRTPSMTDA